MVQYVCIILVIFWFGNVTWQTGICVLLFKVCHSLDPNR